MSTDQPALHSIDSVDVTATTPPRGRKRPLRTYSRRSIQTRAQEEESPQAGGRHPASTPDVERAETPVQLPVLSAHRHTEQAEQAEQAGRSSRGSILAYFKPLPPSSETPSIASSDPAEPLSTPPTSPSSSRAKKRRRLTTRPQFSALEQQSDAGDTVDLGDGDGNGNGNGKRDDESPGKVATGKQSCPSLPDYDKPRPALTEVAVNALCHQNETTNSVTDERPRTKKRLDKRPAKDMTQTTLSLSVHKEPGFTMCSVCDILYNPLNEKDRREHNRRHAAFSRNKKRRAL